MKADPLAAPRFAVQLARAAWIGLLLLLLAWEWFAAPLRPGGSWLVLKALPVALLLPGVLRGDVKTLQWALLLVLLYLAEASVRLFDPPPVFPLALAELVLSTAFFVAAIVHLKPIKRAAKARRKTAHEPAR